MPKEKGGKDRIMKNRKNGFKRLIALLLAGIMAGSMGTSAFAEGASSSVQETVSEQTLADYVKRVLPGHLGLFDRDADLVDISNVYSISESSGLWLCFALEDGQIIGEMVIAELSDGEVTSSFSLCSYPEVDQAAAEGKPIGFISDDGALYLVTEDGETLIDREVISKSDPETVARRAKGIALAKMESEPLTAQLDKDTLRQETVSDEAALDFVKKALPGNLRLMDLDPELVDISNVYSMNETGLYLCFALKDGKIFGIMTLHMYSGGDVETVTSSFSLCSYPEVDRAAAEGKPIGFLRDGGALYLVTEDGVTLIDCEVIGKSDLKAVERRAKGIALAKMESEPLTAQLDKDTLSIEERKLIAVAKKDHSEAVRYYHENMIANGIYGTAILGENSDEELSLLSEKALIWFDKSAGKEVEDQLFRLYVYTDQGKRYMIKVPTETRSLYTAAELLESVPKDEKIVFAVFHYNSYEYTDGKVAIRLSEYTEPWAEVGGSRYSIKSDGTVRTKAAVIDGIRYQFGKDGVCQGTFTGFTKSSKGLRYWKDGTLVKNKWIRVNGERKYYAGADGYFVTGTQKIGGKEVTFDENGAVKKQS